jgi:hypothetical protein
LRVIALGILALARLVGRRRPPLRPPQADVARHDRRVIHPGRAEGRQRAANAAIAQRLVVTDCAVEKHVTNIFSKLGLHTSAGGNLRVLAVLAWLRAHDGGA